MKILQYIFYVIAIIIIKVSASNGVYIGFIPALVLFIFAGKISEFIFGEDPMVPKVGNNEKKSSTNHSAKTSKNENNIKSEVKSNREIISEVRKEPQTAEITESSNVIKSELSALFEKEKEIKSNLSLLQQSLNNGLLTQAEYDTKAGKLNELLIEIQIKKKELLKEQEDAELISRIRFENREKIDLLRKLLNIGELTQEEFKAKETNLLNESKANYRNQSHNIDPSNFKILRDGKLFGYAAKDGQIVIDYQFEDAFPFSEGLACVQLNGKKGFIDNTGFFVIQPIYETATYFKGGKSEVSLGNDFFIIDKKGNRV